MSLFLKEQIDAIQAKLGKKYPDAPEDMVWKTVNCFASAEGTGKTVSRNELVKMVRGSADAIDFCRKEL